MATEHMFQTQRTSLDLILGMVLALGMVVLNLFINFTDAFFNFFSVYGRLPITAVISNFLLFWLAAMLWLAFASWRADSRRRADLEAVVSSISPDVLLVVTPERKIVMCNDSVHRLFGYPSQELIGQSTDFIYSDRRRRRDHPHEIYEALERDGFHIGMATGKRKNGETFSLEIITGDIRGRAGAVLLLRDITYRIEEEERRHSLEIHIQQQQKLESLGMLAGGIAHDFNNLLGAILGHADLAFHDMPDASPVRQNIGQILKAGQRAADLCRELLAYSGKGRFLVEPMDLSQLARDMQSFVSASISKKIAVNYQLGDDLPAVDADALQIRQVLVNLVTRAADAIEGREGTITVTTAAIHADETYLTNSRLDRVPPPGRYVMLRVTDSGRGMTPEVRERLFDPFSGGTSGGGGLGMAAVLGIVRGHRGSIQVDSEPDHGTSITILFPCVMKPEAAGPAPADKADRKREGLVLVVDDEDAIRDLATAMFARAGLSTITASDGAEAVKILGKRHADISLVLLDMTMPRMSGEEAFRKIRMLAPNLPVLLSSGHGEAQSFDLLSGEPRLGFVQKPYTFQTLMDHVHRLVPN
jgi:PAS domain S-box-containing protein